MLRFMINALYGKHYASQVHDFLVDLFNYTTTLLTIYIKCQLFFLCTNLSLEPFKKTTRISKEIVIKSMLFLVQRYIFTLLDII